MKIMCVHIESACFIFKETSNYSEIVTNSSLLIFKCFLYIKIKMDISFQRLYIVSPELSFMCWIYSATIQAVLMIIHYLVIPLWRLSFISETQKSRNQVLQEGGPLPGPESGLCLSLGNELSKERHVLTKQETLLGRGAWAESSRVREPRTFLPCGLQSLVSWQLG